MSVTNLKRRRDMPRAEFIRAHLNAGIPVILEGLLDTWPAMRLWTADYLKARCGQETVEVMGARDSDPEYEINCERHRTAVPFSTYIDRVFSGTGNNEYMVANNGFLDTPTGRTLLPDCPPFPEYLHPHSNGRAFAWIGPAATVTPLHYDSCDIFLAQVVGAKRVRIIGPDETPNLYNRRGVFSDVDYDRPDLARFPLFARVSAAEITLHAGDVLFLPIGVWHHVTALTASISVSFTDFVR